MEDFRKEILMFAGAVVSLKYIPAELSVSQKILRVVFSFMTTYALTEYVCETMQISSRNGIGAVGFVLGTFSMVLADRVFTYLKYGTLPVIGSKKDSENENNANK